MMTTKINFRTAALLAIGTVAAVLFYPAKTIATNTPGTIGTVLVYEAGIVPIPMHLNTFSTPTGVQDFRQIRVVLAGGSGNCSATLVQLDSSGSPIGTLDTFGGANQNCTFTKTYDTPGANLAIQFVSNIATTDAFRFLVYGQPYDPVTK